MTRREKILGGIVGGLAALLLVVWAVYAVFVSPIKAVNKRIAGARERLAKIHAERKAYFAAETRLKEYTRRTFADSLDLASAKSGEMLTRLIIQSGLEEDDFTRLPVGPRKLRGSSEIGWSVQGDGPLSKVVNLVFMLQENSSVHRIDSLAISMGDHPGEARVRFRYLTLVVEPAPDVTFAPVTPSFTLDSVQRRSYDGIVSRDLLRPYLKKAPEPPRPATGPALAAGTPPPGPDSFRVVSLSEWMGQPEIHVRDLTQQKTLRYRPGDTLAGGRIVCVDYRPMPSAVNELVRSDSRVILKIGSDFWAVERGRTLAEKRKLSDAQLPPQLVPINPKLTQAASSTNGILP